MTTKQKCFILQASRQRTNELYRHLFIADTGTLYNGFFGKNGYNNMVIIGQTEDGNLELITDHSDAFDLRNCKGVNIDVMKENGFIRLWLDSQLFKVPLMVLSSCIVETAPRGKK